MPFLEFCIIYINITYQYGKISTFAPANLRNFLLKIKLIFAKFVILCKNYETIILISH